MVIFPHKSQRLRLNKNIALGMRQLTVSNMRKKNALEQNKQKMLNKVKTVRKILNAKACGEMKMCHKKLDGGSNPGKTKEKLETIIYKTYFLNLDKVIGQIRQF